jgi:hypothetical protein
MTPKDTLDRIAALVALASSPAVEEARSAAHKACAMMREHGLAIGIEQDGVLVTRSVAVVAPGRPAPRRTPEHKTVIVFRCARCGRKVDKQGSKCQACITQATPLGIWTVDCQGCGRSTPAGGSEREVNDIAFAMGFIVTEDNVTLCPVCARARRAG